MTKNTFFKKWWRVIGPGVITGAADNDPSGIATYSQAGAQFGNTPLWTTLWLLPLQIAIQEACGRIGIITGAGIADAIKKHYGHWVLYLLVLAVFFANVINIGADIGAMAATLKLILPVNFFLAAITITTIIVLLEIFISYQNYVKILKWLCLSLLAYPITLFFMHAHWSQVLKTSFVPYFKFNFDFLFIVTGIIGTTISPYLFFWEASQEVEETKIKAKTDLIAQLKMDNALGMIFSQATAWCIMVVAANVLHTHGITDIKTAADAAKALQPSLGVWAETIFAIGILGLGFLSLPILAGSCAYAISESINWQSGLNLKFKMAYGFYGVIIVATVIGLLINFIGINPMKALVYAAVVNGIVTAPLIFMIAFIASNKKIMGNYTSGNLSKIFIWITFFITTAIVIMTIVSKVQIG